MNKVALIRSMILAFLDKRETGATCEQIAHHCGLTIASTQKHLRAMRVGGVLSFRGAPTLGFWAVTRHAERTDCYVRKLASERREERRAIANRRRRGDRDAKRESFCVEEWCDSPPQRRIVPADKAAPIKIHGPVSVWELA